MFVLGFYRMTEGASNRADRIPMTPRQLKNDARAFGYTVRGGSANAKCPNAGFASMPLTAQMAVLSVVEVNFVQSTGSFVGHPQALMKAVAFGSERMIDPFNR